MSILGIPITSTGDLVNIAFAGIIVIAALGLIVCIVLNIIECFRGTDGEAEAEEERWVI